MSHVIRTRIKQQIEHFKKSFLQTPDLGFDDFFPADSIADIIENTPHKRSSVFTPLVTLKAFIFQVLSDDGSCKQAVAGVLSDRINDEKLANTINTGPYCRARERLPLKQLNEAAIRVALNLHQQIPSIFRFKGYNVVLADGVIVQMPDTPENQTDYPQPSSQKPGLGNPATRIVALISLAAGSVIAYSLGSYEGKGTGETSLLSQILGSLSVGDLLIADRYYCTFAIIALLQACGIPVLFQIHANKKVDFRLGISLSSKDHVIEWKKPKRKPVWMSEQAYSALPETITVREFAVNGIVYVTTLLNKKEFHKQELACFYKERWKIELDFRSIKTNMGMELLRCKSPEMVRKEIAVHFLAYNIIRVSLAQAAYLYKKVPRQLSFRSAVQIIIQASNLIVSLTGKPLIKALQEFFKAIASTVIGKQKRKSQPRAVKRRPKPYPLLTVPRNKSSVTF